MRQQELIDSVAERARAAGVDINPREVGLVMAAFQGTIAQAVRRGDRITLTNFGTFERTDRKARTARNPRSGAPVRVRASKAPRFRPAGALRSYITSGKTGTSRTPAWAELTTASAARRTSRTTTSRSTAAAGRRLPSGTTRGGRGGGGRRADMSGQMRGQTKMPMGPGPMRRGRRG